MSSRPALASAIHDCTSFQAWLNAQPAAALLLVSGDERVFPEPRSKTSLSFDTKSATYYKGHVGGGGCISGWYDPVHHLVAIRDQYDTYQDLLIFDVAGPVGIRTRDLSHIALDNGIRLGVTRARVEAIEGRGFIRHVAGGISEHYQWTVRIPSDVMTYDISFLFNNDRLVAIDYGYGV